jgi:hypothetical protein
VVVKKNISFDDYQNCVLNDKPKNVIINAIRTVREMMLFIEEKEERTRNGENRR